MNENNTEQIEAIVNATTMSPYLNKNNITSAKDIDKVFDF